MTYVITIDSDVAPKITLEPDVPVVDDVSSTAAVCARKTPVSGAPGGTRVFGGADGDWERSSGKVFGSGGAGTIASTASGFTGGTRVFGGTDDDWERSSGKVFGGGGAETIASTVSGFTGGTRVFGGTDDDWERSSGRVFGIGNVTGIYGTAPVDPVLEVGGVAIDENFGLPVAEVARRTIERAAEREAEAETMRRRQVAAVDAEDAIEASMYENAPQPMNVDISTAENALEAMAALVEGYNTGQTEGGDEKGRQKLFKSLGLDEIRESRMDRQVWRKAIWREFLTNWKRATEPERIKYGKSVYRELERKLGRPPGSLGPRCIP